MRLSELQPLLIETAGGEVLAELVLDEQIAREMKRRDLTLSEQEIAAERELLLTQYSPDPDQARRLLDEVLRRRRMGPRRFEISLRQNAALRKLVADQVNVTDEMVRREYEQRLAVQSVCRLILVPSLRQAHEVLRRLAAGESFTELAIALSTDPSRNQGGLLPPIAPWDVSFPAAITTAAGRLEPGQTSDPVALDDGFAILHCERKITPQDRPFEERAEALRAELRLNLERAFMERLARTLLQEAEISVLDATLDRQFKERRTQLVQP
jgi:foldase protein PrsA